ncbi:MAG: hypothetical protein U0792_12150 [Gemmataceae bacterium]
MFGQLYSFHRGLAALAAAEQKLWVLAVFVLLCHVLVRSGAWDKIYSDCRLRSSARAMPCAFARP